MLGDVLDEAKSLITGQRQADYGKPEVNLTCIADLWTIYLNYKFKLNIKLTGFDSSEMLNLMKQARLMTGKPKRDSPRDAIGYLSILADCFMER